MAPTDLSLLALRQRPLALHRIANKLLDKAEEGDLPSAREVADRLDGKPAQTVDCGNNLTVDLLSDQQLLAIASGAVDPLALPPPDTLTLKPR